MTLTVKQIWIKTLKQVLIIALIALTAGFAVNGIRDDKIQLVEKWSAKSALVTTSGVNLEIALPEAENLFKKGLATFIDARPKTEFETRHVKGAKNLPLFGVLMPGSVFSGSKRPL